MRNERWLQYVLVIIGHQTIAGRDTRTYNRDNTKLKLFRKMEIKISETSFEGLIIIQANVIGIKWN